MLQNLTKLDFFYICLCLNKQDKCIYIYSTREKNIKWTPSEPRENIKLTEKEQRKKYNEARAKLEKKYNWTKSKQRENHNFNTNLIYILNFFHTIKKLIRDKILSREEAEKNIYKCKKRK